ncbi:DeoR/GlpR family DNA-binding transcription regulator [Alkalihalobacillus sp. MEB130]|uniref:DeoR/GlpR family DNA-binding transcription regulator n=1 Tax=Alkalihalobacillus sp. MEB130 TaxID=2976704 RepID=UPI0028DDD2CA|nr:DeoR/GlpR family DNA-binding transcription regulator [Alkalihalobacillus sp. MEB130]MDT8859239.1 DeoR/GlpR family DNA-binding transcription regulator [Alkalihalobacillus sp. MEB130]
MLKSQRIKQISDYINQHKTVSLDDLVSVFDVSKNTIRRDVQELVESGEYKKVYGGVSVNRTRLEPFHDRKTRNLHQKQLIAKKAASYIIDGDVIFIDSGTTTLELIEFIKTLELTIITNNLDFIIQTLPFENLNVISTGGVLERKTKSFASLTKQDILKSHNINKAFMASAGVTIKNGVTNSSPLETDLKRTVVERSSEVFLLVDHNKFDQHAVMTYCDLQEIDVLITDSVPTNHYIQHAQQNNIQLVITD